MKNFFIILCITALSAGCASKKMTTSSYHAEINAHRENYKAGFTNSEHSPLSEQDLKYLDFFGADAKYNCSCKIELVAGQEPFQIKTYSGKEKPYIKYAHVHCASGTDTFTLAVYRSISLMAMPQYKDHLFLPFMDISNGEQTYGGGRYLDLDAKDFEGKTEVNIDFNKCYNPYCAYSDGYNCPIPPVENHLDIAIKAGEKMYKGEKKNKK